MHQNNYKKSLQLAACLHDCHLLKVLLPLPIQVVKAKNYTSSLECIITMTIWALINWIYIFIASYFYIKHLWILLPGTSINHAQGIWFLNATWSKEHTTYYCLICSWMQKRVLQFNEHQRVKLLWHSQLTMFLQYDQNVHI